MSLLAASLAAILVPSVVTGQSDPSPEPLATLTWSSHGDPDDPMENASDVTIAPDGSIWVADTGHSRFAIFDQDGTFLEYWGTEGEGPGEFVLHRPNTDGFANVAFAPDGSFYVLDAGAREIQRYASDRTFIGELGGFGNAPGTYANPLWLAADADGNVLVVDDVRNVVERLSPDGAVLTTFQAVPPELGTADSIELDSNGHIYVSTCCPQSVVRHYDANGGLLWTSPDLREVGGPEDQATGMAVDATGRVFTGATPGAAPDRIRVLGADGSLLGKFGGTGAGPGDIEFPFSLALDGDGALYATDYIDGSVKRFQLGPDVLLPSAD